MEERPQDPLRHWLTTSALPLWASTGFDAANGAFHERLRLDGSPDAGAERRLFVQARQLYVYAHAAMLGWYDGLDRARAAYDWIARYPRADGQPGFAHRLYPDGRIADATRDTYDHAFVLLALAAYQGAGEDAGTLIDDTLAFIDQHLTLSDGSLAEAVPPRLPRRQNPHMHMLEAMLALHDTIRYPGALARAARLVALMREKFLDPATRTLGEYFTDTWAPAPGEAGGSVEPGHQAEWAWLIRKYERLSGTPPGPLARELLEGALRPAMPAGLVDEVDRQHRVRRASRRVWPQTELAKAWIAEAEVGAAGSAERAKAALRALGLYLGRPFRGGWFDQVDAAGAPLSTFVPASTLYHVFVAAAEAERVLDRRPTGPT